MTLSALRVDHWRDHHPETAEAVIKLIHAAQKELVRKELWLNITEAIAEELNIPANDLRWYLLGLDKRYDPGV